MQIYPDAKQPPTWVGHATRQRGVLSIEIATDKNGSIFLSEQIDFTWLATGWVGVAHTEISNAFPTKTKPSPLDRTRRVFGIRLDLETSSDVYLSPSGLKPSPENSVRLRNHGNFKASFVLHHLQEEILRPSAMIRVYLNVTPAILSRTVWSESHLKSWSSRCLMSASSIYRPQALPELYSALQATSSPNPWGTQNENDVTAQVFKTIFLLTYFLRF